MARYTGPMTRKSRRLKVDLVGGDQAFERRPFPPGQHGRVRTKEKEYLPQLQEKQKARFTYGVMEKQFRRYYEEANRRAGKTGDNLLQILESPAGQRRVPGRPGPHPADGPAAGHPRPLPGQRPAGGRPVLPGRAVRHHRRASKSVETFPFDHRQGALGDRPIPAWLQVVPSTLRILIHQLPGACADRLAGHRAADRRVLLEVISLGSELDDPGAPQGGAPGSTAAASYSGCRGA